MSAAPLNSVRLRPPRVAADVIQRHRLFSRIGDSLAAPLLVITAPAGFGKTTLLVSWVLVCGRQVAWLTVSQAESNRADFCRAFIQAVDHVFPSFSQSVYPLL